MRKNKKPGFFRKLTLLLNGLAILALLLCYLATVTNPTSAWYIAFFGLAYPFILLINIVFIIYWLLRKKWFALFSLVAILIGYQSLNYTIGFRGKSNPPLTKDSSTIKLMTYNVHYFKKFGADLDSTTRTGILNLIRKEQPDIAGFQEFFTRKKGKYDIKDSVIRILNTKYYYYESNVDNGYESSGLAVFSKFPIIDKGIVDLEDPQSGNGCIWADIKKDGQIFRVYVVHLASISFQPEDYNYLNKLKADLAPQEDVVSGKRIAKRLKNAYIKRSQQVKILKSYTDSSTVPYIIMGDFNDTPVSYTINTLTKGMKNAFNEKGSGLAITYNGEFPNFQIDYILGTPHFDFKSYNIIKKSYSDHYPVTSNVSLQD